MSRTPQAGKQHPMRCYYCGETTYAVEVGRVVNHDRRTSEENGKRVVFVNDAGKQLVYTTILGKCLRCRGAVVLGKDNESIENRKIYGIWPKEGDPWADLVDQQHSERNASVPHALVGQFYESRRCLKAHCHTAAVVMVRRVLEGVCHDLGFTIQPLAAALRAAHLAGVVDDRLVEWAQALRATGNDGAHFTGQEIDEQDAVDAVNLCAAILDHIYVIPARARQLQQRRGIPPVGSAATTDK